MAVRVLHAADLHIDSPLRGLPPGAVAQVARGATRLAVEALVALALDEAVQVVLLAGDVFDGDWPDFHTGIFFTRQIKLLVDGGARVFITLGNHDAASKLTRRVTLPPGAQIFGHDAVESVDLPDLGLTVHGWSFPRPSYTENPLPRFPEPTPGRVNIGVLHTNLDGRSGHDDYAPTRAADLFDHGYDYWALGHVHTRDQRQQGDRYVVYPGNLQGRHIREAVPRGAPGKGVTLVTIDSGRVQKVEHRPLDVLRWREVVADLGGAETFDEVVDAASRALNDALAGEDLPFVVRVILRGTCAAHGAIQGPADELRSAIEALLPSTPQVHLEEVRVESAPLDGPMTDALADSLREVGAAARVEGAARRRLEEHIRKDLGRFLEGALPELKEELRATGWMGLIPTPSAPLPLDAAIDRAVLDVLHRLRASGGARPG